MVAYLIHIATKTQVETNIHKKSGNFCILLIPKQICNGFTQFEHTQYVMDLQNTQDIQYVMDTQNTVCNGLTERTQYVMDQQNTNTICNAFTEHTYDMSIMDSNCRTMTCELTSRHFPHC